MASPRVMRSGRGTRMEPLASQSLGTLSRALGVIRGFVPIVGLPRHQESTRRAQESSLDKLCLDQRGKNLGHTA